MEMERKAICVLRKNATEECSLTYFHWRSISDRQKDVLSKKYPSVHKELASGPIYFSDAVKLIEITLNLRTVLFKTAAAADAYIDAFEQIRDEQSRREAAARTYNINIELG